MLERPEAIANLFFHKYVWDYRLGKFDTYS